MGRPPYLLLYFCILFCLNAVHAGNHPDIWLPLNRYRELGPDDNTTFYCGDSKAYELQLCQNREFVMNKLLAADVLQYCKYDWWSHHSSSEGSASHEEGENLDWLPGFEADFTNVAYAKNTYLYAIRKMRVQAASDVWICSSKECRTMQDVGFYRGSNGSELLLYTSSTYLENTLVAFPLSGQKESDKRYCLKPDGKVELPPGVGIDATGYNLCFVDSKDVYGPANNTFVPSMVPAYAAAVGVEADSGPYGRLMVGTFMTDAGECVRLIMPRHKWLIDHGWDKQHGCNIKKDNSSSFIFISYFVAGWADANNPTSSPIMKAVSKNLDTWLNNKDDNVTYWWAYARALYCDDDAMSSAYSGARCSNQDFSRDLRDVWALLNETDIDYNWIEGIVIEGIPMLVYNTTTYQKIVGPGQLGPGEEVNSNEGSGYSEVNATHVARWLFSADMLARDNTTVVPWCASDYTYYPTPYDDFDLPPPDSPIPIFRNGTKFYNDTVDAEYNCQLLDSMGLFTVTKGTKPMDSFSTLLTPGLIAWEPYEGATLLGRNLGFSGEERLPPQAVVRAMVEAVGIVQRESQTLADALISTADMTATGMGAALNLYAFTMLALVVFSTAGDFVKVFTADILMHKKRWIWVLYVLPPVAFMATLLPAPLLALLQEINARRNNPQGDVKIDFKQIIARGYGDYHLLVITAYRSKSLYQESTLICAGIAMAFACFGVLVATFYAWRTTLRLKRQLENKKRGIAQTQDVELHITKHTET